MAAIKIGNIRGPKGDVGTSLKILGYFNTEQELFEFATSPAVGDTYGVGSAAPYDIYTYSELNGWVNNGAFQPDINEQTPNYDEATELVTLSSGEAIKIAFGKIAKAIKDLISHLGNKSNPHEVTAKQIGAVALMDNVVVGKIGENNTTKGGVRFGVVYSEEDIPFVGMGTERGTNNLILTSGCDYTNELIKEEIGEYAYYFPVEVPENVLSYPVALKLSYHDGKLYFLRSANGKKHYSKNEIVPMEQYEVIHSGNISSYR